MDVKKIKQLTKSIVQLMVDGKFDKLYSIDRLKETKPNNIIRVIEEYGGSLTPPPSDSFEDLEIYEIEGYYDVIYGVDVFLWIDNFISDLTLKIYIHKDYTFSINDIRIL